MSDQRSGRPGADTDAAVTSPETPGTTNPSPTSGEPPAEPHRAGTAPGQPPVYGTPPGQPPVYGSGPGEPPVYGSAPGQPPAYGSAPGSAPGYGTPPTPGGAPSYGPPPTYGPPAYGPPGVHPPAHPMAPAEERNWAVAAHLSGFVAAYVALGFIGPLVVKLASGDRSAFVRRHSVEALNFNLSVLLYVCVSVPLVFVLIGIPMLVALALLYLVTTIQGALAASRGQEFRYPVTIRFVS